MDRKYGIYAPDGVRLLRRALITAVLSLVFFTVPASAAPQKGSIVTDVTVQTEITPIGQFPTQFVVTVWDASAFDGLRPEAFTLTGQAHGWMDSSLHDVTGTFSALSVKGNTLTLTVDTFSEKYFCVEDFEVVCSDEPSLSFNKGLVSRVITPVADDFEKIRTENGAPFEYNLFTPAKTDKPLPVVVAFHGYGNTENLLENKLATGWAIPENQAVRPAWVIAPVIENYGSVLARDQVYGAVHELLADMIEEGKADPDRIYLVGHSFGGMASLEYAEQYPEDPAAILALASAMNYSTRAFRNLKLITHIPIRFAHAVSDLTIPVSDSRTAFEILENLGAEHVSLREYSDEEMLEAGGNPDTSSPASFHHVEIAVLEDPEYMIWLFDQVRQLPSPDSEASSIAEEMPESTVDSFAEDMPESTVDSFAEDMPESTAESTAESTKDRAGKRR